MGKKKQTLKESQKSNNNIDKMKKQWRKVLSTRMSSNCASTACSVLNDLTDLVAQTMGPNIAAGERLQGGQESVN